MHGGPRQSHDKSTENTLSLQQLEPPMNPAAQFTWQVWMLGRSFLTRSNLCSTGPYTSCTKLGPTPKPKLSRRGPWGISPEFLILYASHQRKQAQHPRHGRCPQKLGTRAKNIFWRKAINLRSVWGRTVSQVFGLCKTTKKMRISVAGPESSWPRHRSR